MKSKYISAVLFAAVSLGVILSILGIWLNVKWLQAVGGMMVVPLITVGMAASLLYLMWLILSAAIRWIRFNRRS